MRGIKIPQYEFALKMQGGLMREGGAYLRDTTVHGYFYFPSNVFVPQVNRHSYSLPLIHQPRAHTNAFQSSFVPSSVSVWNHLPHEALTAHSINSSKSLVAPCFCKL